MALWSQALSGQTLLRYFITGLQVAVLLHVRISSAYASLCRGLSVDVTCMCDGYGHCRPGTVAVDPWLQNALTTQVEVQLDLPFNHVQLFDAHNAYNNRAYGPLYGANDTCIWPPPYNPSLCIGLANQEFSITDLFNFGIRAIELDNWFCYGEMRVAHLGTDDSPFCRNNHVLFSDAVQEIGAWLDDHEEAFIRIYMNEKFDQGNDDAVNGPFELYLRNRVLTPADLRDTYNGEWPTLRTMRKAGKQVVIAQSATAGTGEYYLHQGSYIHKAFWPDVKRRFFTNYPECGGKNDTNVFRFYSDSTHYITDNQDGPTKVGYIDDFSEFIKCRIQYPGADQITPSLMATAVYTWAQGEPANPTTDDNSCILLDATNNRWYSPSDCSQSAYYACQSTTDSSDWTVSSSAGGYDVDTPECPIGYRFGLPQNGYQHQKLLESLDGRSVWLNVAPLLLDYEPPTVPPPEDPTSQPGRANRNDVTNFGLVLIIALFCLVNIL